MNVISYLREIEKTYKHIDILKFLDSIVIYGASYVTGSEEDSNFYDSTKYFVFSKNEGKSISIDKIERGLTAFAESDPDILNFTSNAAKMVLEQPVVASNIKTVVENMNSGHKLILNVYLQRPGISIENTIIPKGADAVNPVNLDNQQLKQGKKKIVSFKAKDLANILAAIPVDAEVLIETDAITGGFERYAIIQFSYDGSTVNLLIDPFAKFND